MKKRLSIIYLSIFLFYTYSIGQNYYLNPIIPGFNPDPSICRVGDDYYLATSTFEYYPGIPIYHSKDLVNWEMIGHALQKPSQLDLDEVNCSGGIYAPTLRYYNGVFYLITTLVGRKTGLPGNFIVTATNPAGQWSEPHWIENAPGIDPSLFFDDDGKVYYSGNISPKKRVWEKHRNIWIQEIDLSTFKLKGYPVQVLDGSEYYKKNSLDGGIESGVNNYEGSHLYKKKGMYYLMISHGGTSHNHAVSIWKSENVWGPYQANPKNPILTHRDLSPNFIFTSTGHADLVETSKGEWWMVYLAKRPIKGSFIMGRETFMSPVNWDDEWPVVNPNGYVGKGELKHKRPKLQACKVSTISIKDEFNSKELSPIWTFIRTPRSEWWSLNHRKGMLRIQLRPEKINEPVNPSFIGIRQQHYNFISSIKMDFTALSINEEAGYVIERDNNHYYKFTVSMANGTRILRLSQKKGENTPELILKELPIKESHYTSLQIIGRETSYTFNYSKDGKKWLTLMNDEDGSFLGINAGRFTGTFIGMYGSSNGQESSNHVDFDWFEYISQKP